MGMPKNGHFYKAHKLKNYISWKISFQIPRP